MKELGSFCNEAVVQELIQELEQSIKDKEKLQSQVSEKNTLIAKLNEENESLNGRITSLNEQLKSLHNADLMLKESERLKREAEELQEQNQKWNEIISAKADRAYEREQAVELEEKRLIAQKQNFEDRVEKGVRQEVARKMDELRNRVNIEQENWLLAREKEFSKKTAILYVKTGVPVVYTGLAVVMIACICIPNIYAEYIFAIPSCLSEIWSGIVTFLGLFPMLFTWLCGLVQDDWIFILPWKYVLFAVLVYGGIPFSIIFLWRKIIPKHTKKGFKDELHRYRWIVTFVMFAVFPFFLAINLSDNIGILSWLSWYLIMTVPFLGAFYYQTRMKPVK